MYLFDFMFCFMVLYVKCLSFIVMSLGLHKTPEKRLSVNNSIEK